MKPFLTAITFLILGAVIAITISDRRSAKHPLVGYWRATDATVFFFRENHTMVGMDCAGHKIWGPWSELNDHQIGFESQSLRTAYCPQYAEATATGMRYNNGNSGFIDAVRIDARTALQTIESAKQDTFDPEWPRPIPLPSEKPPMLHSQSEP